jgi:hypothetical protein
MSREWQKLYSGFWIKEGVGNNAFSFTERRNKEIYVAPLINGSAQDLRIGKNISFSEVVDGKEINTPGLESFIYTHRNGQHIFIFDNHNHAFFFWMAAFQAGFLKQGLRLVHVDQHTDLRDPGEEFDWSLNETVDLVKAFHYTNDVLNVGNFIRPALKTGLFSRVEILNTPLSFDQEFDQDIVLDIDVDIFTPPMDSMTAEYIKTRTSEYLKQAKVVTIATSPFFMDQRRAIEIIQEMLE